MLALAACGGGGGGQEQPSEEGEPVQGGVLIDLQNFAQGEPDHIDPGLSSEIQSSQPGQLIWDGLTENDYKTGELRPMVAEKWESPNGDAKTWVFTLRQGVQWSDGTEVKASDFCRGWNRVVQPDFGSDLAYHFSPIKGYEEVQAGKADTLSGLKCDDAARTVTVELNFPYATFPATTSHLVFSPIHPEVEKLSDQTKYDEGVMIGNGPFKMKEPWKHNQYIKLVRNDNYWGGLNNHKAYLDEIEFRISTDVQAAFNAFEAGEGHTGYTPPARFAEVKQKYEPRFTGDPSLGIYWFGFNMKDPVVGGKENLKLRQAIAHAIDKQAIVDTVFNGSRQVAEQISPPTLPGYQEGLNPNAGHDMNKAKQLYQEWQQETGKRITEPIKVNFNAGAGHEEVAAIVVANLKELGVPAEQDPRDTETYFDEMRKGEGQFFRSGWIWDYVAYDNGLYPLFHSDSIGGDNLPQYENPEFDELVNRARATVDQDQANELYRQAERLVLSDVAAVPLNYYTGQIAYAENVHNLIQSPLQFVAYDEVWMTQ